MTAMAIGWRNSEPCRAPERWQHPAASPVVVITMVSPSPAGFVESLPLALAFPLALDGEFHQQDGVLRRSPMSIRKPIAEGIERGGVERRMATTLRRFAVGKAERIDEGFEEAPKQQT